MLPANPHDFRTAAFWESFFQSRGSAPFEWYASLPEILPELTRLCPLAAGVAAPRVLVPGCGNSELSEELWRAGYCSTHSIDFDAGVIACMRAKTAATCPGLTWEVASVACLPEASHATSSYSVVLDKGLLDAMLPCQDSEEGYRDAAVYLDASARLLQPGSGALLLVSLLQEHVLDFLLRHLAQAPTAHLWQSLDIAFIEPRQQGLEQAPPRDSSLCPFLLTLRRSAAAFHQQPPTSPAAQLRVAVSGAQHAMEGVPSAVRGVRWAQGLRASLSRVTGSVYLSLDLWAAAEQQGGGQGSGEGVGAITPSGTPPSELGYAPQARPLYTCTVADSAAPAAPASTAAVLLVPMGREHEWHFGSRAGQLALCRQAGVGRLVLVTLGVGAANTARFSSMSQAQVQAELSPPILTMLPVSSSAAARSSSARPGAVPFLAVAAELGRREVVAEGHTPLSGLYVVEDCVQEGEEEEEEQGGAFNRRRLVFASNRAALQSEVHLRTGSGSGSGRQVTHALAPCFSYHRAMAAAVAALFTTHPPQPQPQPLTTVLVMGLGGGALPSYLAASLPCSPRLHVVAVELDAAIVQCAVAHFGLPLAGQPVCLQQQGSGGEDQAGVQALARALTPPSTPLPTPGVHVLTGDALHVLQLLNHPAFPPSARPAVILVDVNTGKEELAGGLSFPPPAFVTPSALQQFAGALGAAQQGGLQLLAINLGARTAQLAAEVVGAVQGAFEGRGRVQLVKPGRLSEEEEEEEEGEEEEEEDINTVLLAGQSAERLTLQALRAALPQ